MLVDRLYFVTAMPKYRMVDVVGVVETVVAPHPTTRATTTGQLGLPTNRAAGWTPEARSFAIPEWGFDRVARYRAVAHWPRMLSP